MAERRGEPRSARPREVGLNPGTRRLVVPRLACAVPEMEDLYQPPAVVDAVVNANRTMNQFSYAGPLGYTRPHRGEFR